jgi:Zinc finger, C2H2 type
LRKKNAVWSVLMEVPGFRPPAEASARQHSKIRDVAKSRNYISLIPPLPKTKIVPAPTTDPEPKLLFMCELCGECFAAREALNEHLKGHRSPSQNVVNKRVGPFKCLHRNKCNLVFSTMSELRDHAVEHLGSQLYCPKCGECFLSTYGLELHACHAPQIPDFGDSKPMAAVNMEKVSTCMLCKMQIATRALFKLHVKRHRTPTKQVFKCTLEGCKKPFYAPGDLRLHVILSHLMGDADNFVHACEYPGCKTEFASVTSLFVHKMEKHREKAPKVVDCVTLPFAFVDIKDAIEDCDRFDCN